ncbi:TetR/AcrR family transcriptional regulator [Streptosporangium subroseum]|jgi:AcrR family transcriptional regulator|uniref:Transcriptional regulator, TetR family n=1 Tax=Streptosporangium subroseum TaxID=106412 RepID=A0A239FQ56_9ACTN|nr:MULTISPECIES: TetR/AcrR family transcriptional regulator [Streptosporangium]AWS41298.1 TetR/AcrR family transcriptional regulator [Streptosporangium sp. 'caverna']WSA15280.1 TetR/AcrR family transcriptional regulator [Streptosporangium subroseum]SNS58343.1 transcriptional regulator, TetR family [Streptosporangium subroseum]
MTSSAPRGLQGAYLLGERASQDELRGKLLDVASQLLVTIGPESLSMRRIATEAGCSTTVIYTMFGSKEGLAEALYLEGFERFRRRLEAVPPRKNALEHLSALGPAYRDAALAEPGYYALMFERAIPGFAPSERARTLARAALNVLDRVIADCISAGYIIPIQPRKIADALWAAAQGAISLERAGHLRDSGTYDAVTRATVSRYLADKS